MEPQLFTAIALLALGVGAGLALLLIGNNVRRRMLDDGERARAATERRRRLGPRYLKLVHNSAGKVELHASDDGSSYMPLEEHEQQRFRFRVVATSALPAVEVKATDGDGNPLDFAALNAGPLDGVRNAFALSFGDADPLNPSTWVPPPVDTNMHHGEQLASIDTAPEAQPHGVDGADNTGTLGDLGGNSDGGGSSGDF